jgi:hypothetical protein
MPIDPAEFAQALLETRNQRSPRGGRAYAAWPRRRRTGHKRDELASLHSQSHDAPSPSVSGFFGTGPSGRMSEVGQNRTLAKPRVMSALP